jgi:hypothetical protein
MNTRRHEWHLNSGLQICSQREPDNSGMADGLLDAVNPEDVSDLFTKLKSLK